MRGSPYRNVAISADDPGALDSALVAMRRHRWLEGRRRPDAAPPAAPEDYACLDTDENVLPILYVMLAVAVGVLAAVVVLYVDRFP